MEYKMLSSEHLTIYKILRKLEKNYIIEFNTDTFLIDWNEWTKLYIQNEKIHEFNSKKFILLDLFIFVVVESYNKNFEFMIGGVFYKFLKGRKYLPILSYFNKTYIEIKKNLNVYISKNHNSFLYNLSLAFSLTYKNYDLLEENTSNKLKILCHNNSLCGAAFRHDFNGVYVELDSFYNDCINNAKCDESYNLFHR